MSLPYPKGMKIHTEMVDHGSVLEVSIDIPKPIRTRYGVIVPEGAIDKPVARAVDIMLRKFWRYLGAM